MPKLKFLDAKMIDESEWSLIHSKSLIDENSMQSDENITTLNKRSWWRRIFGSKKVEEAANDVTVGNVYSPLPEDVMNETYYQSPKTSYGKIKQHYKGTESQGNRFIGNQML